MTALFHALFRLLLCSDVKNDHIAVLEHAKLFHSLIEIAVVCCLSTYNRCMTLAAFRLQAESSFSERTVAVTGVSHLQSK